MNIKLQFKDKGTWTNSTCFTFFQQLIKQPSIFSKFYSIYNQQQKNLKTLTEIETINRPIQKNFRTTSSIKKAKNTNKANNELDVYHNSPPKINFSLGKLG